MGVGEEVVVVLECGYVWRADLESDFGFVGGEGVGERFDERGG